MQFFPTAVCNWALFNWPMALVEGGGGEAEGEVCILRSPTNWSVSCLSFIYGRCLRAELNGGENYLHWKANMLPLLRIMSLWPQSQLRQQRSSVLTAHTTGTSIFNRGSSLRFICSVLNPRFQMDPLDRQERWAIICFNKGCTLLWKNTENKSLIRDGLPIYAFLPRYLKATVMQLKRFFHREVPTALLCTKQYCEWWTDDATLMLVTNTSGYYLVEGLQGLQRHFAYSIANGFAMLDLTSELIRKSKLPSLFVGGKIPEDFLRGEFSFGCEKHETTILSLTLSTSVNIFYNNQRKRNNDCVVNDREFALKNSSTLNKCLILNIFCFNPT